MFANFFSFYFLLGSLIPGTNFSDLIHIPDLVNHYALHMEEAALLNEDYSLLRFINDHFINPDKHTQGEHDQDHQDLPLRNIASSMFITCAFSMVEITVSHAELNVNFSYFLAEAPGCDKPIFQPPI